MPPPPSCLEASAAAAAQVAGGRRRGRKAEAESATTAACRLHVAARGRSGTCTSLLTSPPVERQHSCAHPAGRTKVWRLSAAASARCQAASLPPLPPAVGGPAPAVAGAGAAVACRGCAAAISNCYTAQWLCSTSSQVCQLFGGGLACCSMACWPRDRLLPMPSPWPALRWADAADENAMCTLCEVAVRRADAGQIALRMSGKGGTGYRARPAIAQCGPAVQMRVRDNNTRCEDCLPPCARMCAPWRLWLASMQPQRISATR